MTKIKNTGAYPIKKYPIPSDFFIGSDSENNGETINFEIQKIINMASGLKDYIFSMSSLPIVSPQGDGYFQTNGIKNFALITTLSISKKTLAGQDLTPFMTWLGSNLTEFTLYIVSKTNQNIFADFSITNVTQHTDYFVFTVELAPGDNYLGELIEKDIYTFNYEKTAAGSALDLLTQVITDGDTLHAPSADAVFDALFLKAPLASPALTGVPTAPTAAPGTNTIQLANTSFVTAALTLLDATLLHKTGNEVKTGTLTVNSIIRAGGLATQFLKADGSIDSNTYLTAESDTLQSVTNRGAVTTTSLTALSFIKTGGLASQFLKANGSIDANVYALDSSVIHNTGNETKTGTLTVNSIIKAGGTASQFLKADGSSDATVYAVDSTVIHTTGNEVKTGSLTVNSIIRAGGLATQFLKADGSIDSNTYLTAESDTLQSVTARGATTTLGITALSFIKSGGTASQYLMADGSVTTAANIIIPATQVTATPHVDYLTGANVQLQLDNTETNVVGLYKIDKTDDKTLKQTGRYRPDTDVSVLSISPADTLNITACDNILFVNEIMPDVPANKVPDFLKSFGNKSFVANGTNTPLAADTRGIFYVGLDKLGNQVYRTSKIYDQDVAYMARLLVNNTAGVYTIVSAKYFPDLANNRVNNRDRLVLSSGYIVPSGAASISFGNRGMTYSKNSINYSNNKLDPNYLTIADSVNPTPMSFLFFLPNITSLAVSIATSTVIDPTVWYTAGGAVGGGAVNPIHYQVYRLFITVTGTIAIQTKASTTNAPDPGVNAIFATREAALAGLTSTIFPDILPVGDSIALGTFYLRAGTAVNGSTMLDPNDFYFRPFTATSSSSSVGVTVHDLLSGKNDNPTFQHVTTTDIANWNIAYTNRITSLTTTGTSGAATLISNVLNIPIYAPQSGSANYIQNQNASAQSANMWINGVAQATSFIKNGAPAQNILLAGGGDIAYSETAVDSTIVRRSGSGAIITGGYLATTLAVTDAVPLGDFATFLAGDPTIRRSSAGAVKTALGLDNGFILNQNASAQSANMWISGIGSFGSNVTVGGLIDINGIANIKGNIALIKTGGSAIFSLNSDASAFDVLDFNASRYNFNNARVYVNGSRPITISGLDGAIYINGSSAGWATGLVISGEDGSQKAMFGGYGSGSSFNYAFIGYDYSSSWMTYFPNGNVAINNNSDNGVDKLQVNGSVWINSNLKVASEVFAQNGYWFRPSGVDRALLRAEVGSGDIKLYQYDSGAGYLRDTFTIPNATGNVLINTTSDNGYKLRVNGSIYSDNDVVANGRISTSSLLLPGNIKRSFLITQPAPAFGNCRKFVKIKDNTTDTFISGKITISGDWHYAPVMGVVTLETGIYVGAGGTAIAEGRSRLTGGTSKAYDNLSISDLTVVGGYIGFYIYSVDTNFIYLQFDGIDGGNAIWDWSTPWESFAFPSKRGVTFEDKVGIGIVSPFTTLNVNKVGQSLASASPSGGFLLTDVVGTSYSLEMGIHVGSGPWIQSRSYADATMYPLSINPSGGNVMIGQTNNDGISKLTVNGTIRAPRFTWDGATTTPAGTVTTESAFHNIGAGFGYGISTNVIGGLDIMANQSGQPIRFWAGGDNINPIERVRFHGNGNVGIGNTTDNGYKLQVNGGATFNGPIFASSANIDGGGSNGNIRISTNNGSGQAYSHYIYPGFVEFSTGLDSATGNYIISAASTLAIPRFTLTQGGNATFVGTVTATGGFFNSDARLKDVISRDGDVAYFKWKDQRDSKQHIGVIAQEVQEVYPDMVLEGADGMLSVNYTELLLQKILLLEKRISELESKLK